MRLGKWAERIYKETDFARNLSTAAAGSAGLAMYLYRDDLAVAAFGAAIVFPIVKIVASAAHSHWKETRERDRTKAELMELYHNLGHEELAVVKAFVSHGGTVITWKDCSDSSGFSHAGIRSLINRKLIREGEIGEYGADTLALDTELFEYARGLWIKEFLS